MVSFERSGSYPMRSHIVVLVALAFTGAGVAQPMGPGMMMGGEMGMGMGMGMMASSLVDVGPVWSPDGRQLIFSRVTASFQGNNWTITPVSGGMGMGMGMGMEGGMMPMGGAEMGMGGMPGMGMTGPNLQLEGLFQVAATGGEPNSLLGGRAVVHSASRNRFAFVFQGMGNQQYQQWGIYGMDANGGNQTKWYPGAQLKWVSISPSGGLFAVPYEQGKAVVFFPAQENAQQNVGYCQSADLTRPVSWTSDSEGVWVLQQAQVARPAQPMQPMGMMGPEAMGMMGGMGMGGFAAAQPTFAIAIGKLDQSVTPVIEKVGQDSFAVSIPNSSDIAASLSAPAGAQPSQVKTWPGALEGIYIYGTDGNQKRKLTNQKARYMEASPDGKHVAFMWGDKAPYTLSVAPVDGLPVRRVGYNLVGSVGGSKPFGWSPDSSGLAYGAQDDEANGVFVVDISTGQTVQVSKAPKPQQPAAQPMAP